MIRGVDDRRVLFSALVVTVLLPVAVAAQRGQDAGLVGTIRDASGAILAGASVTVSSPQLIGGPQTASTDNEGTYRFAFLPPGDYEILAELARFKSAKRTGVMLAPGLMFTVDFKLDVAAIKEVVLVEGRGPVVDVRASSAPVLIDNTMLENLPLSRTPSSGVGTVADTVNLAPGVIQSVALGGTFLSNPLSLDGANGNEPGFGTPTVYPNLNWIDEVQVVSVGADAQYGEYTGALVNATTRSGSNRFSGLVDYWTTRPGWTSDNRDSLTPQLQERFIPVEIVDRWDSDFQLGGPLRKDRLWFFAGGEAYRDAYWPTTFTGVVKTPGAFDYDATEHRFIGKLTSAITPTIRAEGYIEHGNQNATGANARPLITPDASAISNRPETMWNVRLLWTVSSRAFVELRNGGHDFSSYYGPPDDRRSGPPAHYDQLTGVTSANVTGVSTWHDRPIATGASFTYFIAGSGRNNHEIKSGFEYEHASLQTFSGYVGGRLFYDVGGQPSEVELWDGATNRPTQSRHTFYAQDAWSATDRLTLNLGVRMGIYRGSVPGYEDAFSGHSVSPRLGAAFDLVGDHRTVLRAHYGRYHDEMVTSFYDFLDPLSQAPDIFATVVGPNEFVEEYRLPSSALASIDPHIKFPFVDEYFAGIEQELPWGISGRAQYIRRDFKESIAFTDPARTWLPVQSIDPGPDGKRGTADDGGPVTVYYDQDPSKSAPVLTNPADAYRRYNAVQLIGTKRYSHNIGFQLSYTWSRTFGNYNNAFASNAANNDLGINGAFMNPNRAINYDGRTRQDFTHDLKLLGSYQLSPWGGLVVSGVYRYQSGRPWARSAGGFGPQTEVGTIFMEPPGTRETPAVNALDLRVEKTWRPSPKLGRLGLFVDVFNVWNQGVALRITNISGPNFGVPVLWLDPRTVRAGVRLMF